MKNKEIKTAFKEKTNEIMKTNRESWEVVLLVRKPCMTNMILGLIEERNKLRKIGVRIVNEKN